MKTDSYYMNIAIKEAIKAEQIDEIPVGAVIVDQNGFIIGKGYNKREKLNQTIGHAEIEAIRKANKKNNNRRLLNCTMYVTLEPCEMCKKVIKESKIEKVIYCINNSSVNNYEVGYKTIEDSSLSKIYNKIFKESFKKIR